MRGTIAKRLRKKIDKGEKEIVKYHDIIHSKYEFAGKTIIKSTRFCEGKRKRYKSLKKLYKELKIKGE